MSDSSEGAAEFAAMSANTDLSVLARLGYAYKAIEWFERALSEARAQALDEARVPGLDSETPSAWRDLVEGLTLLSRGQNNAISPLNCTHDQLTVCADPSNFTRHELARLDKLGFHEDGDGSFFSTRFGSA